MISKSVNVAMILVILSITGFMIYFCNVHFNCNFTDAVIIQQCKINNTYMTIVLSIFGGSISFLSVVVRKSINESEAETK